MCGFVGFASHYHRVSITGNKKKLFRSNTVYQRDAMISWKCTGAETALKNTLSNGAITASAGGAFPLGNGVAGKGIGAAAPKTPASMDDDRRLSFDQIHQKYQGKIYNLIYKWVGNQDDAEDLTIITFTNAWKAWGRFRGDAQVSTWLHQIAHNNFKNYVAQQSRKRQYEGMSLDEGVDMGSGEGEISREVADWSAVPEDVLLSTEFAEQVKKAIDALAPDYRIVLVLAEQEEMSYEEIARITGLTVPNVKTRLHRARNRVRQRLEPYYRGWSRGTGEDAPPKPPKK